MAVTRPRTHEDLARDGVYVGYLAGYPAAWEQQPGRFDHEYQRVRHLSCSQCGRWGTLRPWFYHHDPEANWQEPREALVIGRCDACSGAEVVE
jgi:hypothetical protein